LQRGGRDIAAVALGSHSTTTSTGHKEWTREKRQQSILKGLRRNGKGAEEEWKAETRGRQPSHNHDATGKKRAKRSSTLSTDERCRVKAARALEDGTHI
jgi:hypothetical protein